MLQVADSSADTSAFVYDPDKAQMTYQCKYYDLSRCKHKLLYVTMRITVLLVIEVIYFVYHFYCECPYPAARMYALMYILTLNYG